MLGRLRAGEHGRVDPGAVGCVDSAQLAVDAILDNPCQVWKIAFQDQGANHVHLHAIDTDQNHARFGLARVSGLDRGRTRPAKGRRNRTAGNLCI